MSQNGPNFRPNFADDSGDLYNSDEYIPPPSSQKTLTGLNKPPEEGVPPHKEETREDGTVVRTFFPEQLPELKRSDNTPPPTNRPARLVLIGVRLLGVLTVVCVLVSVVILSSESLRPSALGSLVELRGAQPAGPPAADSPRTPTLTPTRMPTLPSPTASQPTLPTAAAGQVYVPGGIFLMGAEVEVTLSSFYIDVYEVTNEQWQACVQAGACREPTSTAGYTGEPYYGDPAYANHPVIAITWFDAADYCAWAGGRLPTEAEWEMAARWDPITQQTTLYPWGDAPLEGRANTCGLECPLPNSGNTRDAYPQTAPVGSFEDGVSPVGAYDMAGNVAEWVADWYAAYPSGPLSDPTGPADGERRVVRGGAWGVPLSNANSVQRSRFTPDSDSLGLGVRCVKER